MASTNPDLAGDRPTSWSAAVDQAAAASMKGDRTEDAPEAARRLIFLSVANVGDDVALTAVTEGRLDPVQDPAQAWNALSIGGYTDRDTIDDRKFADWTLAAAVGDRSPYSTTSTDWTSAAPIKPELLFEAGNRIVSPARTETLAGIDSVSLLSTSKDFITEPLTPFWATSAATAQAAGMAAAIMAAHSDYWPETVRALMVHSADWTPRMQERLNQAGSNKTKYLQLVREYGYGVPNLARALASARSPAMP